MDPKQILDYWFADAATAKPDDLKSHFQRWFQGGKEVDEEINSRFGKLVEQAASDKLAVWENTTEGTLALIILLDQFTRNVYRGTDKAFAFDDKALGLSQKLIESGEDKKLHWPQRGFAYMPMQHAEDSKVQAKGIEAYRGLVDDVPGDLREVVMGFLQSAREHKAIVDKYGRFPHRNKVLGRESTEEELIYLANGAKRFGQ
ncbi:MAG: DUF924 domain-containing protein [Acidiferrobacterales bacterium]|jgi:uncharacterized protein (DUF924 family)|nr:DUF924 domain-containing protein [Acidiferrobacterales bacterium]